MRRTILLSAAALAMAAGVANASPLGGGLNGAIGKSDLVQDAAYIVGGNRYCFYFDGWQGPGWYRCGFAWRRGLGWGGAYGWQNWTYAPYERRHGGNHMHRSSNNVHINRNATVNRNTTVNRNATVQQNRTVRGSNITRNNTRVNGSAKIGGSMHRSTTGAGASQGSVHVNGGGNGGTNAAGGGKGEKH